MNKKKRLVILTDWFIPGFRAGGPIRSCHNLAGLLKDHYEVKVVTTNLDLGESEPYQNIEPNTWTEIESGINVWYFSKDSLSFVNLKKLINNLLPATIYLNSMYSLPFTIWPIIILFNRLNKIKIILAPRGMLDKDALAIKSPKKKLFLFFFKLLGLEKKLAFHATSIQERNDIHTSLGTDVRITTITNVPKVYQPAWQPISKSINSVDLIYLSRITPIKNVISLLELISQIPSELRINLTIAGPVEEDKYWIACKNIMSQFPQHIRWNYIGKVSHSEVHDTLINHHALGLLTKTENFGHIIFETFQAGRLALISDQTPWRNLARLRIGWDLDLEDKKMMLEALRELIKMDQSKYDEWSYQAWKYAKLFIEDSNLVKNYDELFRASMAHSSLMK